MVGSLTDTRYLYTCQEYDLTTGLYYYDARWYDPAVGKFISVDTISFAAGDANLYRYVKNSPLTCIDPNGLRLIDLEINSDKDSEEPVWKKADAPWNTTKKNIEKYGDQVFAANEKMTREMIKWVSDLDKDVFNNFVKGGCVSFAGKKFEPGVAGWSTKQDYIAKLNRELTSRRERLTAGGFDAVKDKLKAIAKEQTEFYDNTVVELHGAGGKILIGSSALEGIKAITELYNAFEGAGGKGSFGRAACQLKDRLEKEWVQFSVCRRKFIVSADRKSGCISYKPMSFKLQKMDIRRDLHWRTQSFEDSVGPRIP